MNLLTDPQPRIGKDKRNLVWSETKVNNDEQDLTINIQRLGMKEVQNASVDEVPGEKWTVNTVDNARRFEEK